MQRPHFPIHHTFGPLATSAQAALAFRLQFQPRRWRNGHAIEEVRSILSHAFGMSCSLFSSGREALLAALRSLDLHPGDEIILPAFTCVVVPNAIHAAGGTPVYCEVDPETLSIDVKKIQMKITPRTRAILCQHTFGIPAETERLRAICDKRGLFLIEDCAHVLPESGMSGQMSLMHTPTSTESIGRFGDFLLFSFGRDKAISAVTGGAILTRHGEIGTNIALHEKNAEQLSLASIGHLLGYPLRYRAARALWRLPFGAPLAKGYLHAHRVMGLLPPVLTGEEKKGGAALLLHRFPDACALLLLQQLSDLRSINAHRRSFTDIYLRAVKEGGWRVPNAVTSSPALQKFPIFLRDAEGARAALKREQIYLDDGWCGAVVNPCSVDQEAAGYARGSCPVAEDIARHVLTLPLHPLMTEAQAQYLILALREWV